MNRNEDRTPWKAPHPLGVELRVFELDEDLNAGSSASAKYVFRNEDSEDWEAEATATMTVYDLFGFHGTTGQRGPCFRYGRYWIVLNVEC